MGIKVHSFTFHFAVPGFVKLGGFSGYFIRGLVFNLLGRASPLLPTRLHASRQWAFSVTPPLQDGVFSFFSLKEGGASFYVHTMKEEVREALLSAMGSLETVRIGDRDFPLLEVEVMESEVGPEPIPQSFELKFVTPTYFKRDDLIYPLPDPTLMVHNLARAAGIDPRPLRNWASRNFAVAGFPRGIRTMRIREPRSSVFYIGFVGRTRFSFIRDPPEEILTLLSLAKYIGVGLNRSMGFGRITIEKK